MAKVFLFDAAKCNGCYDCQIVCKDEHCENDWRPYAAPQPETGQFWCRVDEKTRGQVPWVRVAYKPVLCAHCADAPCAAVCADGAFERREDGLLIINPDKCTGCGKCVDACPQGSIYFNAEIKVAQKCTGCAHLLDNGWDVPRCVDACSHEALIYKEESEIADLLAKAEAGAEVAGFGPKMFFLNLPKRFIAGTAVDFAADEVIIGAKAAIAGADGFTAELDTDEFGDFVFDQIPAGVYTLTIKAEGYKEFSQQVDVTEIDISVGDLSIEK